jgi:excisionase family DNA binding protein
VEYLSVQAFAERASVSTMTIRRRIADGSVPAVRFGRLLRIPASALDSLGPAVTSKSA